MRFLRDEKVLARITNPNLLRKLSKETDYVGWKRETEKTHFRRDANTSTGLQTCLVFNLKIFLSYTPRTNARLTIKSGREKGATLEARNTKYVSYLFAFESISVSYR